MLSGKITVSHNIYHHTNVYHYIQNSCVPLEIIMYSYTTSKHQLVCFNYRLYNTAYYFYHYMPQGPQAAVFLLYDTRQSLLTVIKLSYRTLGGMGICLFIKHRIYVYLWTLGDNVHLGTGWITCLIHVLLNGFEFCQVEHTEECIQTNSIDCWSDHLKNVNWWLLIN